MPESPYVPQPTTRTRRSMALLRMLAYFVLLGVGVRILSELFAELSATRYADTLTRVSALAAAVLDWNKNLDDLMVTFFALAIALLLILPVAWIHTLTKGEQSDPSLTQTLIVLSVIVAGVMLLVEDSLARSFSLVGVVAAVRYRNTLKDPRDAVYVFLSLAIGMACGLQAFHIALFLSLFQCAILLALWVYQTGAPAEAKVLESLKAAEKKGHRTPAEALAWLTPDARDRLDADLELQGHYIATAKRLAHGKNKKKRPNAVITVVTTGTGTARDAINTLMEDHKGKWRLLGSEQHDGLTSLEYLGRVAKKRTPPVAFLERLGKADADVKHVGFRSLRKMVPEKSEANGAAEARPTVQTGHDGKAEPRFITPEYKHPGRRPE